MITVASFWQYFWLVASASIWQHCQTIFWQSLCKLVLQVWLASFWQYCWKVLSASIWHCCLLGFWQALCKFALLGYCKVTLGANINHMAMLQYTKWAANIHYYSIFIPGTHLARFSQPLCKVISQAYGNIAMQPFGRRFATTSQDPQIGKSCFAGSYKAQGNPLLLVIWILSFHASLNWAQWLLIAWHRSSRIQFGKPGLTKPAVLWPWTSPVKEYLQLQLQACVWWFIFFFYFSYIARLPCRCFASFMQDCFGK